MAMMKCVHSRHNGCVGALLICLLGLPLAYAEPTEHQMDEEQAIRIYKQVVPATVFLSSSYTAGTGWISNIGVVLGEPWVVSMQGHALHTVQDFIDTIKTLKVGDRVLIKYIRDRVRGQLTVVVGERPSGSMRPLK